jgi:hypothetical protein
VLLLQLMPKGAAFSPSNKEKVHYFHTLEDNYGALVGSHFFWQNSQVHTLVSGTTCCPSMQSETGRWWLCSLFIWQSWSCTVQQPRSGMHVQMQSVLRVK